jgi:hypothetical protein
MVSQTDDSNVPGRATLEKQSSRGTYIITGASVESRAWMKSVTFAIRPQSSARRRSCRRNRRWPEQESSEQLVQRPRDFRQGRLLDLSHSDVAGSVVDCGRTTIRRVAMGIKSAAVDS